MPIDSWVKVQGHIFCPSCDIFFLPPVSASLRLSTLYGLCFGLVSSCLFFVIYSVSALVWSLPVSFLLSILSLLWSGFFLTLFCCFFCLCFFWSLPVSFLSSILSLLCSDLFLSLFCCLFCLRFGLPVSFLMSILFLPCSILYLSLLEILLDLSSI